MIVKLLILMAVLTFAMARPQLYSGYGYNGYAAGYPGYYGGYSGYASPYTVGTYGTYGSPYSYGYGYY